MRILSEYIAELHSRERRDRNRDRERGAQYNPKEGYIEGRERNSDPDGRCSKDYSGQGRDHIL